MKFICTNKGRFSVYEQGIGFAEFIDGIFETDNVGWLDVLKNVQGVLVIEEGVQNTTDTIIVDDEHPPFVDLLIKPIPSPKKKPEHSRRGRQ